MSKYSDMDRDILARTLYGESEAGNVVDAKHIASVIMNRVELPNWPDSPSEVCMQPFQFSCWNANDPNRQRIMKASGDWFKKCQDIADVATGVGVADPYRLTHYYETKSKSPGWAKGKRPCFAVAHRNGGAHVFFNDIDTAPPKNAREALDQRRPISDTRTVRGSQITTAGVIGSGLSGTLSDVQGQLSPLVAYSDAIKWLFILVAVIGVGITVYARVSDRSEGRR